VSPHVLAAGLVSPEVVTGSDLAQSQDRGWCSQAELSFGSPWLKMALVSTGAGILGPGFLPLHASRPLAGLLAGMTRSLGRWR